LSNTDDRIHRYFDLAPQHNADAYFAQFTDDAVVHDEGEEHRGIAAIRSWRANVPVVTYAVHDSSETATGLDARVDVAGDFPGSPVRLTFQFGFADDGRITALTIGP
jgi:hypothetical protein